MSFLVAWRLGNLSPEAGHWVASHSILAHMIFAPVPGLFFIFLALVLPGLCLIGTLGLILIFVLKRRTEAGRESLARHKGRLIAGAVLVALLDCFYAFVLIDGYRTYIEIKEQALNREKRAHFTLSQPVQHCELLMPTGTQITRYDAFDNGEPERPQKLTGLISARFPEPVLIGGAWAIALQSVQGELELARDQVIQGQACKTGQIARFDVPLIEYDIVAEFGQEVPDGPLARFKPSQWVFRSCNPA
ncbi:hypothetical protein [Uliginosibacterium sp. 31-12]|uniref:hypothetical protein n=1 Tax=Uliginosibacterium sp. 31-12 TaxID=3062781 RepID=UPI0026E27564|nr:hypothetical protein [Uliginosibacterium sp. 31-12]MDO6386999.1 hypothetical protein [Uliginosibacterium sp. 31-12]